MTVAVKALLDGPITYFPELFQGSEEWFEARRGMLTASEMHLILTPTLKQASNEKERSHLYELLAQRISGFVEPSYVSDDMLRGKEDEIAARYAYSCYYAPVTDMGFIVNRRHGVAIGFSPDGLVGDDGFIECKSRRQKFQVQTIVEHVAIADGSIPADYLLQVQTGLIVSERNWCDLVSYSGGLPMAVLRVLPDPVVQNAILEAALAFETRLQAKLELYRSAEADPSIRLIPTVRTVQQEIYV